MSVIFKQFQWADIEFDDLETIESTGPGVPRLYKTPQGNFPSMTSILGQLDDGGIEKWRKRVGEEEADRICNEAVDRGNNLHDYNELYLQNRLERSMLSGQARTLFNRVKRFLDQIDLVVATEAALYSANYKYAGRVDAIGMISDDIVIIDHKNSRNPINLDSKFGLKKLFKYQVQTCGYARALHEMKNIKATKGCLIVGNHLTSSANRFIYDLEPFYRELDILIHAYYNDGEGLENSLYFQL